MSGWLVAVTTQFERLLHTFAILLVK